MLQEVGEVTSEMSKLLPMATLKHKQMEKLRPFCFNVDYQVGTSNNSNELFENGKGVERNESSLSKMQATPVSPATQAIQATQA